MADAPGDKQYDKMLKRAVKFIGQAETVCWEDKVSANAPLRPGCSPVLTDKTLSLPAQVIFLENKGATKRVIADAFIQITGSVPWPNQQKGSETAKAAKASAPAPAPANASVTKPPRTPAKAAVARTPEDRLQSDDMFGWVASRWRLHARHLTIVRSRLSPSIRQLAPAATSPW